MNVLIVEDDNRLRATLALLLRANQCDVVEAGLLSEARVAVNAQRFDVVLVDLGLPNGDGCELLRELGKETRKIVLTGWIEGQYWQAALAAGVEKILPKPVDAKALISAIQPPTSSRCCFAASVAS